MRYYMNIQPDSFGTETSDEETEFYGDKLQTALEKEFPEIIFDTDCGNNSFIAEDMLEKIHAAEARLYLQVIAEPFSL